MSLPILKTTTDASPEALVRYFHQTELQWTRHTSQEAQLDVGVAMYNAELPRTYAANRVLDAAVPADVSPAEAVRIVDEHFTNVGSTCWQWVMNPSAPPERTRPLVDHLLAHGWSRDACDVMYVDRMPTAPISIPRDPGLTIIPARASYKHARQLFEEAAADWNTPELADADMLHLDDPHVDALLALKDGRAVAHVGVLAAGEIGRIESVYVTKPMRGQGVGTLMISRAMEICARSLFKHILLGVAPNNGNAIAVYQKFGFRRVGEFIAYQRPRG
jgi:ribosomal protein S18 acetylase RimI-like enzyme